MTEIYMTANNGAILGPISKVLGWIMDKIYMVLSSLGISSIALSIVLLTVLIYLCLLPLTYRQQKFSVLTRKMQPELKAIQNKYKGKKDQASMMAQQEETQRIYDKYGISPAGSCVQILIQMPILFALYRVIYNVPAYVNSVKEAFIPFVSEFITKSNALSFISNKDNFANAVQFSKQFENEAFKLGGDNSYIINTFIDVLNRASTSEWSNIADKYPDIADLCRNTYETVMRYNNFFGLNIADSPKYYITDWWSNKGSIGLAIGALLIPILSALTQWINTKLMPQAEQTGNNEQANAMAASMKSMNVMMPLMSLVFVFTLPIGMGIYWIAGAVIRSVQQIFINKHIDKIDIDAIVAKNTEKFEKQIEKKSGVTGSALNSAARISTRTLTEKSHTDTLNDKQREETVKKSTEYYNKGFKPGSLASKANMVRQYNEKNNK